MFRAAAVLAAAALMTFAGCTKVDDTLGSNLVPDNQQMKVGYTTLGARTLAGKLDAAKYVETRLFQSDSLKASNISYGYMGSMLSDTFGLRTAGFLTQYLNVYEVKEGYFGYRPIFDSAQILITITSYGNDTLTPQKYNVYEIKSNKYLTEKPVAAGKTERDTVFYLNFDPVKEGVIGADDEPVFTFTFPDGETTGPATTAVTMNTTPATQNFIDRLMLQKGSGTAYEDDYSIYSTDSLKQWVEEFKGLYIVPAEDQQEKGKGNIYATELESSGFMVYARNRVESDPTLIKDTIGMGYIFYNTSISTEYGNVSVNTIRRDYGMATSTDAKFDIADAKETSEPITSHPTYDQIYVEGMGGVVTAITFDKPFFVGSRDRRRQRGRPELQDARHDSGPHVDLLQGQQLRLDEADRHGAYDRRDGQVADPSGPLHQLQDTLGHSRLRLCLRAELQHDARLRRLHQPQPRLLCDGHHGLRPESVEQLPVRQGGTRSGRSVGRAEGEDQEPHDLSGSRSLQRLYDDVQRPSGHDARRRDRGGRSDQDRRHVQPDQIRDKQPEKRNLSVTYLGFRISEK